jgi:hypothetical protein
MEKRRRGWLRPIVAIGVMGALTGGLLASPVGAHFVPKDERKHVRKIARRIAKKEATTIVQTTVGPTTFIEETELVRFGPIKMQSGEADKTIGTFGTATTGFRLTTNCETVAAVLDAEVLVDANEDNSTFFSNDDDEADFDAADPPEEWAQFTGAAPGGAQGTNTQDDQAHASSPSDINISGGTTINTNFDGAHCVFAGHVIVESPL